jgi:murein endopeptidase
MNPDHAWGRTSVIWRLTEVLFRYNTTYPDAPPVLVKDISRRHGGRLPPHVSHRSGRDVDIAVVRKRGPNDRAVPATPRTIDAERTWFLIHSLIRSGEVQYVFLHRRLIRVLRRHARQQGMSRQEIRRIFHNPRRGRHAPGIIRAEPGHQAHFHVRFHRRSNLVALATGFCL